MRTALGKLEENLLNANNLLKKNIYTSLQFQPNAAVVQFARSHMRQSNQAQFGRKVLLTVMHHRAH